MPEAPAHGDVGDARAARRVGRLVAHALQAQRYARERRLEAVHALLRAARCDGQPVSVTEAAMRYGFLHMSRFAARYRERFGCTPSETLRRS